MLVVNTLGGSQQKNKISDTAMNVGTRMTKESEKQSRQREAKLPVVSRPSGVATSLSVDENQDPMNGNTTLCLSVICLVYKSTACINFNEVSFFSLPASFLSFLFSNYLCVCVYVLAFAS